MFEVAHNTVADVGDVDWKKAAEVWPTWHATDFDVDQMVQQSAKQLGLVKFVAFLWQEGTTRKPMPPDDFAQCAIVSERPVVVALLDRGGVDKRQYDAFCELVSKRMRTKVKVSDVGLTVWGSIQETAGGISATAYTEKVTGLKVIPHHRMLWGELSEPRYAAEYMDNIDKNLVESYGPDYAIIDIRRNKDFLAVPEFNAALGFDLVGTSDVGLIRKTDLNCHMGANGIKWLWEAKKTISKPGRQDNHLFYWIDGDSIVYIDAPNADVAWAMTRAMIKETWDAAPGEEVPPSWWQHFANRRKMQWQPGAGSSDQLAGAAE